MWEESQLSAAGPKLVSCADPELPGPRAGGGFRFEVLRQRARIQLPKGAKAAWLGDAEPQPLSGWPLLAQSPVLSILRSLCLRPGCQGFAALSGWEWTWPTGRAALLPLLPSPLQSSASLG